MRHIERNILSCVTGLLVISGCKPGFRRNHSSSVDCFDRLFHGTNVPVTIEDCFINDTVGGYAGVARVVVTNGAPQSIAIGFTNSLGSGSEKDVTTRREMLSMQASIIVKSIKYPNASQIPWSEIEDWRLRNVGNDKIVVGFEKETNRAWIFGIGK
jgi:hypothetical protein